MLSLLDFALRIVSLRVLKKEDKKNKIQGMPAKVFHILAEYRVRTRARN